MRAITRHLELTRSCDTRCSLLEDTTHVRVEYGDIWVGYVEISCGVVPCVGSIHRLRWNHQIRNTEHSLFTHSPLRRLRDLTLQRRTSDLRLLRRACQDIKN
jgi:hypothetical protein